MYMYAHDMNYDAYYLEHHGIKGQKWGQRRFQNEDGSVTAAGRQRYGIGERMKIRIRGVGQEIRSTANNVKNAKGFGNKTSELIGYGRMRTHQQNRSRVQKRLSDASRTRLGKAIHNQRSANAGHNMRYAEIMRNKSIGEKIVENTLMPINALKTPYTRLSGRTTTVGKQCVDNLLTSGAYGLAKDVEYLSNKKKS